MPPLVQELWLLCIVAPVTVFLAEVPLLTEVLPLEVWSVYFWGVQTFAACLFSHALGFELSKVRPTWPGIVLMATAVVALQAALFIRGRSVANLVVCLAAAQVCVLVPAALRVYSEWGVVAEGGAGPGLWHTAGAASGVLPLAAGLVAFQAMRPSGVHIAFRIVVWLLLPVLPKLLCRPIWKRAGPRCKASAQVLWSLYVDVVFDVFAIVAFSESLQASLVYALASSLGLAAPLWLGGIRGLPGRPGASARTPLAQARRLTWFLEALVWLVSRSSAYVFVLCLTSFWSLHGRNHGGLGHMSSEGIVGLDALFVVDLLFRPPGSRESIVGMILCLVVTALQFLAFNVAVTRLWRSEVDARRPSDGTPVETGDADLDGIVPGGHVAGSRAPEPVAGKYQAAADLAEDAEGGEWDSEAKAGRQGEAAEGEVLGRRAEGNSPLRPDGRRGAPGAGDERWLGGRSTAESATQQIALMGAFLDQHRLCIGSTVVFVIHSCSAFVGLGAAVAS